MKVDYRQYYTTLGDLRIAIFGVWMKLERPTPLIFY